MHYFSDRLTGEGVDESVLFHLKFGLKGAGITEFYDILLYSIITFILILGCSILAFYLFESKREENINKIRLKFGVIVFFIAITVNPGVQNIILLVTSYTDSVDNMILSNEYIKISKANKIKDTKNVGLIKDLGSATDLVF